MGWQEGCWWELELLEPPALTAVRVEQTRSSHSLGSPSLDVPPVPSLGSRGQLGASEPSFKGKLLSRTAHLAALEWSSVSYTVNVDQARVCPFPASPPGAAGCLSTQQMCALLRPEQQQWFLGQQTPLPSACQSAGPTCAGNFRSLCNQSWINNNNCCDTKSS